MPLGNYRPRRDRRTREASSFTSHFLPLAWEVDRISGDRVLVDMALINPFTPGSPWDFGITGFSNVTPTVLPTSHFQCKELDSTSYYDCIFAEVDYAGAIILTFTTYPQFDSIIAYDGACAALNTAFGMSVAPFVKRLPAV